MNQSKNSKWISHPWSVALGSLALSHFIIPAFISKFSEVGYFEAMNSMWAFLISPLKVPLIVVVVILITGLILLIKNLPIYKFYTRDKFYGMVWKWNVPKYGEKSDLHISIPTWNQYCPHCDMKLQWKAANDKGGYLCVKCDKFFSVGKYISSEECVLISDEVARRIRTGQWKWFWLKQRLVGMQNEDFTSNKMG